MVGIESLPVRVPAFGRIPFLDRLRAVAIVMVVGVHTSAYCLPLSEYQKEVISFLTLTVAVPTFFLVDGYLFARDTILPSKETTYFTYVQKSFFRLIVPWTIFTLLYTVARYFFEINGFLKDKVVVGRSLKEVAILAYGAVPSAQMYFLFSLFLIRLCSPIFKKITRVKNVFFVPLSFLCYYAVYKSCIGFIYPYLKIDGGLEPILHALAGIPFYLVGIILLKTSSVFNLKKLFLPCLLSFLMVLPIRGEWGHPGVVLTQYLYLITLFLFFLAFGDRLSFLDRIGRNTMGIYLIHIPIVLKVVSLILNRFTVVPLWSFMSIFVCTFFLTFFIVSTINAVPYGPLLLGTPYQRKNNVLASN